MSPEKKQVQPKKVRKQKSPNLRNKAFKFRIYPTEKQIGNLAWTFRRCKELYNAALQERRDAYNMSSVSVSNSTQNKQLPEIKEIREEYQDIQGTLAPLPESAQQKKRFLAQAIKKNRERECHCGVRRSGSLQHDQASTACVGREWKVFTKWSRRKGWPQQEHLGCRVECVCRSLYEQSGRGWLHSRQSGTQGYLPSLLIMRVCREE